MQRKKIIIGNWKMNKNISGAEKFCKNLDKLTKNIKNLDFGICANFLCLSQIAKKYRFIVGAQNCDYHESGAFTGEVSYSMLEDIGINYCIIGHSERRYIYLENDFIVEKKLRKLLQNDFNVILCVGETISQFESDLTEKAINTQLESALENVTKKMLENLIIAYEPIWAIGTGRSATSEMADKRCHFYPSSNWKTLWWRSFWKNSNSIWWIC